MLIQAEPGLAIWTIVTFLLLAFVLGKFAWKPMLTMLQEREKTIKDSLDQARMAREESESLLAQNRAILADARNQANDLLEKARQAAEDRQAKIAAKAREEAEALLARSRQEIDRQRRRALREIRAEAADLAIAAASRVVKQSLDGPAHRRLVDEYFSSLPEAASPEEGSMSTRV
ncbi:MAG: F0F1 ATP synthase subunit B [Acidobacteriota bacterium]